MESTIPAEKADLYTGVRGRDRAPGRPGDTGASTTRRRCSSRSASRTSRRSSSSRCVDENALAGLAVRRLLRRRDAEVEPRRRCAARSRPRPPQPGRVPGSPGDAAPRPALVPARAADRRAEHVPGLAHVRRRLRLPRSGSSGRRRTATTLSVSGHATGRVPTTVEFRRTRLRPGSTGHGLGRRWRRRPASDGHEPGAT